MYETSACGLHYKTIEKQFITVTFTHTKASIFVSFDIKIEVQSGLGTIIYSCVNKQWFHLVNHFCNSK